MRRASCETAGHGDDRVRHLQIARLPGERIQRLPRVPCKSIQRAVVLLRDCRRAIRPHATALNGRSRAAGRRRRFAGAEHQHGLALGHQRAEFSMIAPCTIGESRTPPMSSDQQDGIEHIDRARHDAFRACISHTSNGASSAAAPIVMTRRCRSGRLAKSPDALIQPEQPEHQRLRADDPGQDGQHRWYEKSAGIEKIEAQQERQVPRNAGQRCIAKKHNAGTRKDRHDRASSSDNRAALPENSVRDGMNMGVVFIGYSTLDERIADDAAYSIDLRIFQAGA
jgi:hypothetical protein